MRYYSDTLRKFFESEDECLTAEKDYSNKLAKEEAEKKALAEKRSTRAKEVESLYKAAAEAKKAYTKALSEFVRDYGSYHATFRTTDPLLFDLFDWF